MRRTGYSSTKLNKDMMQQYLFKDKLDIS